MERPYRSDNKRHGAAEEQEMKLYAISQSVSTFGQTEAGCHTASGPEKIVASATIHGKPWAEMKKEQEAFMKAVRPSVSIPVGNRYLAVPVEPTARGFAIVAEIVRNRTNTQPHVECGYRLVFSTTPPELDQGSLHIDGGNLAYQKALLAGKA